MPISLFVFVEVLKQHTSLSAMVRKEINYNLRVKKDELLRECSPNGFESFQIAEDMMLKFDEF